MSCDVARWILSDQQGSVPKFSFEPFGDDPMLLKTL
jgi:hypothetical protein